VGHVIRDTETWCQECLHLGLKAYDVHPLFRSAGPNAAGSDGVAPDPTRP
jgi:hypothetical protein